MNFVLDIGNVLIDFKPELFLRSLLNDRRQERMINDLIFNGPEWKKLDEGIMTQEEALSIFCKKEPENREVIEKVMMNLTDMLTPIPETIELLPKIKAAGHKLYFLSNYHVKLRQYACTEFEFFDLFDGGVFSCDVHLLKPSVEVFRYFLDKYRLEPERCLFFDDMEQNVMAAKSVGMKGVLFRGVQDIARFL